MKHIVKRDEPPAFTNWKAQASTDWQPVYGDLSGEVKKELKDALRTEQGHLCCYCERRLTDEDSHIEHFRPQRDPAVDPLDFGNMLCSCQNQIKKGEPRHCGSLKADWFDPNLLISPLNPDCEARFSFEGNGVIKPADETDSAAIATISRLGLNISKLIALRKKAIEPFLEPDLTEEELRCFVQGYLQKDSEGRWGEFWTTLRYVLREYSDG